MYRTEKILSTRFDKTFYLFFFTGQDLLDDHRFTVDCVQPKCTELRRLVQKLEVMLGEKRRILHKFLDLIDGIEAANKWSTSALSHLSRQEDPRSSLTDEDVSHTVILPDWGFLKMGPLLKQFLNPFCFCMYLGSFTLPYLSTKLNEYS